MSDYLRLIDVSTGGPRCDVTPLFADSAAFAALTADLAAPFRAVPFEYVVGIDALGFILGAALALELHKGFVPIRKGGKLPVAAERAEFVDYSGQLKALELRAGLLPAGSRVLLTDEWIETGAQAAAAAELVERQRGQVIGIATINMDDQPTTRALRARYRCHALSWGEL